MAVRANLSAPFSHREFNGEHLFAELKQLRLGQVTQKDLVETALALKALGKLRAPELAQRLRLMAKERAPAIGTLLKDWSGKVQKEDDVAALISHAQRLAMTAALIDAARKGNARLPAKGTRR